MNSDGNKEERTYEEWTEYRNAVTDFIIKNSAEGSSAAILGAGRCNDIDVGKLSSHFSEITLMDRDTKAMSEAEEKYNAKMKTNAGKNCFVSTVTADFTGITDTDFSITSTYCGANLVNAIKTNSLKEYGDGLLEEIRRIYDENSGYEPELGEKCYDYVIVFGTHSQLNNNFSAQWHGFREMVMSSLQSDEMRRRLGAEFDNITRKVEQLQRENTQRIIGRFDDAVVKMARKGLLLGIETGNTGKEHSEIDGAYNAICDFSTRTEAGELQMKDEQRLVWPFSAKNGISYDVRALSLKIC